MCSQCRKPLDILGSRCSKCREKEKIAARDRVAQNICRGCRKPLDVLGFSRCSICREKEKLAARKRTAKRRAGGLCSCGKEIEDNNFSTCNDCLNRTRTWVKNVRENRLCIRCLDLLETDEWYCRQCRDFLNEKQQKENELLTQKQICISCKINTTSSGGSCYTCLLKRREADLKLKIEG